MKMNLHLALKREYFEAIKSGEKTEEYRLITPYWRARLYNREYGGIILTSGYPRSGDGNRRLQRPWRGVRITRITHPHFGPHSVDVFAIDVRP